MLSEAVFLVVCIGYMVYSKGSILLRNTSNALFGFGKGERTIKVELHIITVALEKTFSIYDCENVRIQLDNSTEVEILEGKVAKYFIETMDTVCRITQYLKFIDEYSVSHLYRELNEDFDYLASLSGASIDEEEFNCLNK